MGRCTRWAAFAAWIFPTFLAAPASASPVVVSFTGVLTTVNDPQGLLAAAVVPGALVTGTLSYEFSPSCQPVSPTICEYLVSPSTLSLAIAATPIASVDGGAYIYVEDGPPADSFSASVGVPAGPAGASGPVWLSGDLQVSDPSTSALNSTALPTTLDLTRFAQRTFDAGGCYGGTCAAGPQDQFQIIGTVLTMELVPEPGSAVLLAVGLLALCGRGPDRPRVSRLAVD